MPDQKKIVVVFGIGDFEKKLLSALSGRFTVLAVDMNQGLVEGLAEECPEINCLAGDASSILTWKKIETKDLLHVISSLSDWDVNREICRIVRETYALDIPITLLACEPGDEKKFQKYAAVVLSPVDIGITAVVNRLEKNYTKASDIGLKKGEFIEVPIQARSHLVGKTLNMLRPTKWHLAGLYRDNQLLIPKGDTQIRLKDRVVLFGDPVVVETIANRLLRGDPQFPLQFGSRIAFPIHKGLKEHIPELNYIRDSIKTQKQIGIPLGHTISPELPDCEQGPAAESVEELFAQQEHIGLYFLPFPGFSFFQRRKLPHLLRLATKPLLLSRGSFPYDNIVVSLNCSEPATALELGIDLTRLFKLPLEAVHIAMPESLRSQEEDEQIKERQNLIADFEHIHKMKIHFSLLAGNPVNASLSFLQQRPKSLLVLLYSTTRKSSLFSPHVQLHIARKTGLSTLLIPIEADYEE